MSEVSDLGSDQYYVHSNSVDSVTKERDAQPKSNNRVNNTMKRIWSVFINGITSGLRTVEKKNNKLSRVKKISVTGNKSKPVGKNKKKCFFIAKVIDNIKDLLQISKVKPEVQSFQEKYKQHEGDISLEDVPELEKFLELSEFLGCEKIPKGHPGIQNVRLLREQLDDGSSRLTGKLRFILEPGLSRKNYAEQILYQLKKAELVKKEDDNSRYDIEMTIEQALLAAEFLKKGKYKKIQNLQL